MCSTNFKSLTPYLGLDCAVASLTTEIKHSAQIIFVRYCNMNYHVLLTIFVVLGNVSGQIRKSTDANFLV